MKSHELLREVFQDHNPKEIADSMGLSVSMVYKWAEAPEQGSGAANPLDRMAGLVESTQDVRIVEWLCTRVDGFFIRNPKAKGMKSYAVVPATNRVVQEFAEMLSVIANAALDNDITTEDAGRIRLKWEDLKSVTEGFVRACEDEKFHVIHGGKPAGANE
jgi:hypothetical protein